MPFIATSASRVSEHTAPEINRRIADETTERLARIGDDQSAITQRLLELDAEWDVERAIQLNAGALALTGTLLGLKVHRGFLVIPALVTAFLVQHAVQGWCPPLPVLRHLGFRTPREIENERHVLLERRKSGG